MKEDNINQNECQIHVMPTPISDEDLSALFKGLVNVVKKKFELDTKSHFIAINNNMNKLSKALEEKTAECNRLKNEIIYLKSKIKNDE